MYNLAEYLNLLLRVSFLAPQDPDGDFIAEGARLLLNSINAQVDRGALPTFAPSRGSIEALSASAIALLLSEVTDYTVDELFEPLSINEARVYAAQGDGTCECGICLRGRAATPSPEDHAQHMDTEIPRLGGRIAAYTRTGNPLEVIDGGKDEVSPESPMFNPNRDEGPYDN